MKPTLIVYSTTDGQTLRICQRLQAALQQRQLPWQLLPVGDALGMDVSAFGMVVIGASVRYGRHRQEVHDFIIRHKAALQQRPSFFFSVSAVGRKPGRQTAQTNPYVRKLLRQTAWQPHHVAIFAGKIDYPRCSWRDRQIIRLIMWLTNGPTDVRGCTEFTDWDQVDALGRLIAQQQEQLAQHKA